MSVRDIAAPNWQDFLNDFAARHDTWLVDIDAFRPPAGQAEQIVQDLHLIRFEVGDDEIRVILRRSADSDFIHRISRPSAVRHTLTGDGRGEELQIQGAGGASVVRFHSGAAPHL